MSGGMNREYTDERWSQLWEIFHECSELDGEARRRQIEKRCAGDTAMIDELVELLGEHDQPSSALEPQRDDLPGELDSGSRIGPYTIEALIGEGGMGMVYRATQTDPVRRTVALKLIRPGMDSREILSRFRHERQTLALLQHENIARVFDAAANEDGRPYFAMEFVDGVPITRYCRDRELSLSQRLELFDSVCRGVQHAHHRGIIHRDLKPSNVLVTEIDGGPIPKIIDFGIARATESDQPGRTYATRVGSVMGTPEYMSPEQAGLTDSGVDTRTDVYALGAILYELLTDRLLFDWQTLRESGPAAVHEAIREKEPPPPSRRSPDSPDIPSDLDWITLKALEKERERRYNSPQDLADDVQRFLQHRPVEASPPSTSYRVRKFVRRHRVAVAAGAAVVIALATGATVGTIGVMRSIESGRIAQQEAATAEKVTDFLSLVFAQGRPGDQGDVSVREALDQGVISIRDSLQDEPEVRGRLLIELGKVYRQQSDYAQARELIGEGATLLTAALGPAHRRTIEADLELGNLEFETGRHAEARPHLERARQHAQEIAPGSELELRIEETLAYVLGELGDDEGALELSESILRVYQTDASRPKLQLARAYYNVALGYARVGRDDDVEPTLMDAIAIFEELEDATWIGFAFNSLSIHYWQKQEYERALPYCERALATIVQSHGESHRYTAAQMDNLGLLYTELGRFDEARELAEKAYALRLDILGDQHAEVATSQLNLGRLYGEMDERQRCREHFELGLETRANLQGAQPDSLIRPMRRYAEFLEEWGDADAAESWRQRAAALESES